MAYGDPKIVVDVKDTEHGEILYTDAEGKSRHYYPAHTTWFEVESLHLLTVLDEPSKDETEPRISKRFRGVARVDATSLGVVGDPSAKAQSVMVTLEADRGGLTELAQELGDPSMLMAPSGVMGSASLGFSRADWEFGNPSQYWLSVYLPHVAMDALLAEANAGKLSGLRVTARFRYLYTDDHPLAPPASRGNLFLRPDREDNTINRPQIAPGLVSMVVMQSPEVAFASPKAGPDEVPEPTETEQHQAAPASPTATAIEALSARVEAMRGTLKWVSAFLIVALLYAAHR